MADDQDLVMMDAVDAEMVQREDGEMELDAKLTLSRSLIVTIDQEHPFDLDTYISQYSGRVAAQHLLHISATCPQLTGLALQRAVNVYRKETRDSNGYLAAIQAYHSLDASKQAGPVPVDSAWVEATELKNAKEKNKLEAELKTYTSNMIKESIRLAQRELASFHHQTGNLQESIKHYSKCREFCSTNQHVIEMCILVLEVLIEQRSYSHIQTYVYKAEGSLDSSSGTSAKKATAGASNTTAGPSSAEARERMQAKLDLATALSFLGQGHYEKAARGFLKIGSVKGLEHWIGQIVSASDIAIFGVLCSLATLSRSALKAAVIESDTFTMFIEQERYIRDLLDAYMGSRFKDVLAILERHYPRHALSPMLAPHLPALTAQIRSRALVLYFTPFQSVRLETMSAAFGIEMKQLEAEIVKLIKEGKVKGRVDGLNKILQSRSADEDLRSSVYKRVLQSGKDMQAANRKLLMRMSLLQSDLLVKAPKGAAEKERFVGSSSFELYD